MRDFRLTEAIRRLRRLHRQKYKGQEQQAGAGLRRAIPLFLLLPLLTAPAPLSLLSA
jgi:hypothetical protein